MLILIVENLGNFQENREWHGMFPTLVSSVRMLSLFGVFRFSQGLLERVVTRSSTLFLCINTSLGTRGK